MGPRPAGKWPGVEGGFSIDLAVGIFNIPMYDTTWSNIRTGDDFVITSELI
jgi:hypothetical protein